MNQSRIAAAALLAALPCPSPALAQAEEDPILTPYADIRYRLELVDQQGLPEDAAASTLRMRAGVRTGKWHGVSAQLEGEAIARLGPADFNDTVNAMTVFPVVADPGDILLNQAYVSWRPDALIEASAGRQVVNIDNQRWIGSVGWRQNDQTLDAVRLSLRPARGLTAEYLHAWRVNRVFGPDSPQGTWRDTDIHGLRGAYNIDPIGTLSVYSYWLDIPSSPASSSRTAGVRITGTQSAGNGVNLVYSAEYARQSDHAANPVDYRLDYLLLEPGVSVSSLTARLGFERLEGNGVAALQTPLATLHAFNGWSDKFLVTPAGGLRDIYLDTSYQFADDTRLKGLTLRLVYHDFNSTRAGLDYGHEWNALAAYPLNSKTTLLAKFARFEARDLATDTFKAWFQLETRF